MKHRRICVIIETDGQIPNYEVHVRRPLARIVAHAFNFALQPRGHILPDEIEVRHDSNIILEEGTLVAVTINTGFNEFHIQNPDVLKSAIAQSISDTGMFRCRYTPGLVRLETNLPRRTSAYDFMLVNLLANPVVRAPTSRRLTPGDS